MYVKHALDEIISHLSIGSSREKDKKNSHFKVVDPQKLDLTQKSIILLSGIAILLLKGYFGREKTNFHEKKS